tara:strand:- start:220 stop:2064 length:1845 start_codon:yes stop_codon:yes gene_type:complete
MKENKRVSYIKNVLEKMPSSWLTNTTHRLDIYEEKLAKTQFIKQFEILFNNDNYEQMALHNLPTAYDYIRLGHPLSCVLEWALGKSNNIKSENVISFSSKTIPVLAILRKNLLNNKNTKINYIGEAPEFLKGRILKDVYGYKYELNNIATTEELLAFDGTSIFITNQSKVTNVELPSTIDFYVICYTELGSILLINKGYNEDYISEIQHVRRRETIAMTPENCLIALKSLLNETELNSKKNAQSIHKRLVTDSLLDITGTKKTPIIGSSGLSIQYAIMMGLIDDTLEKHPEKDIKIIVPTNCYGGTNDQARRLASCIENVQVIDLDVDGKNDMVKSIENVLNTIANEDGVPYIIAEIPTNPRVKVPNLTKLKEVLIKERKTKNKKIAIKPVLILDQTFCPNIRFMDENKILSKVIAISYVSGSKFPSGGLCTAGYCVANERAAGLMKKIETHLTLCNNEANPLQIELLAKQLPSMNNRIEAAYKNARRFVNFIKATLPDTKINFVSERLAKEGYTPSVFSLDLPTKGSSDKEKETYKRALNLKLINLMIQEIPNESKFCVSYGQLKGCYWTIPATSTQGTTKEKDKDYIVRVSLSPDMDIKKHENVFMDFVNSL